MPEKILTISVAAYNVEQYLRNTLESCENPLILNDIEVLIINDGSKDNTSKIAHEFADKYPDTYIVVDKENGGYGTTVNTSMKMARGKYFKLLDGDDWFDKEGLGKLVSFLRNNDADVVMCGRAEVTEEGKRKHSDNEWFRLYADAMKDQTVSIVELTPFIYGMWVITYKTELLKEHPFSLPEHLLYTDCMYVAFPIPWVRTYAFQNYDVYCYRVGHEGQSVSAENKIRHLKDLTDGYEMMLQFYKNLPDIPQRNHEFLDLRMFLYYYRVIMTILLLPASTDALAKIKEMEKKLLNASPALYSYCGKRSRMLWAFRKSAYSLYWLRKLKKVDNWA